MSLLEKIASFLVKATCKIDEADEDYGYCIYIMEGILYFIKYIFIAGLMAIPLRYLQYMPIFICTFLFARELSGGMHQNTPLYCMLNTLLIYLIFGLVTIHLKDLYLPFFLLSFIIFHDIENTPKYAWHQPRHRDEKQKTFRLLYIVRVLSIMLLNLFIIILHLEGVSFVLFGYLYELNAISVCISSCLIMNRLFLTDLAFSLAKKLPHYDPEVEAENLAD